MASLEIYNRPMKVAYIGDVAAYKQMNAMTKGVAKMPLPSDKKWYILWLQNCLNVVMIKRFHSKVWKLGAGIELRFLISSWGTLVYFSLCLIANNGQISSDIARGLVFLIDSRYKGCWIHYRQLSARCVWLRGLNIQPQKLCSRRILNLARTQSWNIMQYY